MGIILMEMIRSTTGVSCQFHGVAHFPTVCERMKWIPADWYNGINAAMSGLGSGEGTAW